MLKKVLIVDDDPQIVSLYRAILSRRPYNIATAMSGEAALRSIAADPPDLVILDLSMPEPDGFEILKHLREKAPQLKVLVISGFLGGSMLRAAEFCGAMATLSKTDAPTRLLEAVSSLIGPA